MKKRFFISTVALLATVCGYGCTNLIITKGASVDSSVMVSDVADSHTRYGVLDYRLGGHHRKGEMRGIYQWGSDSKGAFRYTGSIPEAEYTYNVMSNMNEYQVIIGETTYDGDYKAFVDTTAIIDYGSMMNIALQRSKTAREAIAVMVEITDKYGYTNSGETLSIADANEAWVMDIMPRKPKYDANGVNTNKGIVYVAIRIPDGCICAHANCARIDRFPLNDPENCLYSKDVIDQAREMGWYEGPDEEFSFRDAYCPVTSLSVVRSCDMRVWSFFRKWGEEDMDQYIDYVTGENTEHHLPLYVKAKAKLSVHDVAEMMRDHYEGTIFDMRKGIAAGPFECPYRWRDNDWKVDSVKYRNERPIAVQQAGFWFIGQARGYLPREVGALLWFAVDDPATAPITPVYACSQEISDHYRFGNGSQVTYSPTSMFWLVNRVAQQSYLNYKWAGAEARKNVVEHELEMMEKVKESDAQAIKLLNGSSKKAVKYLTKFSVDAQDALFDKWEKLDKYLLVKYIDCNVKKQNPDGSFEVFEHQYQGVSNFVPKSPKAPGLSEAYKRAVVNETGDFLKNKEMPDPRKKGK